MTKAMRTALAVAGVMAFAPAAMAATTVNGSKSNGSEFNACVKGGGTVKKDSNGNQDCTPKGEKPTARATTVKSSKSNTSDRMGGGGGKGTAPAESTNLNSSRSN